MAKTPRAEERPYRGPRPFGHFLLKHCDAARILGIKPKHLTQRTDVRREFYGKAYVYDPQHIAEMALAINKHPKDNK